MGRLLIICTTNAFKTSHARNFPTASLLQPLSNTFRHLEGELFCHYGDLDLIPGECSDLSLLHHVHIGSVSQSARYST